MGTVISAGIATMKTVRSMFAGAALLALPAEAQEHRFEDDPVVMVRENFVACDVLSQLQRVVFHLRPAFAVAPSDADVDRHACVALAETDCVAGHVGFEPANPSASHLVGFA